MEVFFFLLLFIDLVLSIVLFCEMEKVLDNTFSIGNDLRRIDKTYIRKRKGKK